MLYRHFIQRTVVLFVLLGVFALTGLAQAADQAANQAIDSISITPIYVTARIFQLSAPRGQYQEPSDQVFRVSTANYTDETKWIASLKKTYPGFTPALLTTAVQRVYRTSKPQIVKVGQMGTSSLDLLLNGAQSAGENDKPGTTLIAEINLSQGGTATPVTHALQPMEVESGKTYFFAMRTLKLSGDSYVKMLQRWAPASHYAKEDIILLFAFSVELEKPAVTSRYFGDRDSVALQRDATKKVQPVMPTSLQQIGLRGKVQVRVEIAPTGKITNAITQTSSFPEMNEAVITAARQWEFAPTLFAQNPQPINGLLTFDFSATAK